MRMNFFCWLLGYLLAVAAIFVFNWCVVTNPNAWLAVSSLEGMCLATTIFWADDPEPRR